MSSMGTLVKELRGKTGAGILDCQNALKETDSDIEKAIDLLRQRGLAAAQKKAGRETKEGVVSSYIHAGSKIGVLVEVNCETDFVAKDENFQGFSSQLADTLLEQPGATADSAGELPLNNTGTQTVEDTRQQLVTKLGENISIRRFARLNKTAGGTLGIYLHGIRIGVIVDLSTDNPGLAKDLAMHIAASNPLCVNEEDVAPQVLENERQIQLAQARQSGKPDEIVEKMVSGRIKKFLRENTLTGQAFVKDPDTSVAALLKANNASVNGFIRYEVGEGIEKKVDNFAAEVMQQAGLTNE